MPFAAAASTAPHAARAAADAARAVRAALGRDPELAVAFFSPHLAADAADIARAIHQDLGGPALVGVLGEGVIAGAKEIEAQPAVAVWAGAWDGKLAVDAFHLDLEDTPDGPTLFGWPDAMFEATADDSLLLCFGDPYTFPAVELFLPRVNEDYPGVPVVGGMASNPTGPGTPSLILNDDVRMQGAVGVLLRGSARFKTVVSQGCRPVGRPLVITKGQDNLISEVGGQTPLEYLRALLEQVPPGDKDLMQRGLLIGLAITEYRDEFRRGDFLIRNLIGLDPRTGALAVTDRIRRGQTIQFQVRDARTAGEDLRHLLEAATADGFKPAGGLTFSCNGRGTRLFPEPDHDARTIQELVGPLALAGFFAAGELGPVGGTNFIHGFTASSVLFE
jgi:small ligand-binding sensory domain FIST